MAKKLKATEKRRAAPPSKAQAKSPNRALVIHSITLDVDALRHRVQHEKMDRFLDELDKEHGPPKPEDTAKAKESWKRLHPSS